MAEKCSPCIEKKVNDLIANSGGKWTEEDRESLLTLSEVVLDKIAQPEVKEVTKEVQVNVLSDEDRNALAAYKAEQKAKRDKMCAEIQANTSKELWPDATLKLMDDDTVKRLFDSVKKDEVVDYSVNGAGMPISNYSASSEVEPLYPSFVQIETKK